MSESLNAQQSAALRAVQGGRNIFLTGAGGTGKSHTIRAICAWLQSNRVRYAITAMTGCAAMLLGSGAKTLHSWAGVGLAREAPHELAEIIKRNRRAARRWLDTQVLIIDEISMMTAEFLEKLDHIARRIRRNNERFGGIRLLLAGDFCQLPPVVRGVSGEDLGMTRFVFEFPIWASLIDETIQLTELKRQSDPVFQTILNEARLGKLSEESLRILQSRVNIPWQDNEIRPTLLFTRNAEVSDINRRNMTTLDGERHTYSVQTVMTDSTPGSAASTRVIYPDEPDMVASLERLDADAPYDATLDLCVGAQVMLLTNMDQARGLVNGSRGVLQGYTPSGLPIVKFLSCEAPVVVNRANWWLPDMDYIGRSQIPLKVAYAVTIHKSQGATLDSALIDVGSSTFEYGQAYVALSRVRSLEGLYIWKLDPKRIRAHPAVVAFYESLNATPAPSPSPAPIPTPPSSSALAPAGSIKPWTLTDVSPAWSAVLNPFLSSEKGRRLADRIQSCTIPTTPSPPDVFNALRACPDPASVKVVLIGQDPYPTAGNAHGLSFSVSTHTKKLPPSLQNIYKELASDLNTSPPITGCLQSWADQGVLLLNDVLTVSVGAPQSHAGFGWEELTTQLLATVLAAAPHVVVIAWGRHAQKKLDNTGIKHALVKHTILTAAHPSPLSAHTGFFGTRPFSQTNAALVAHGQEPIAWI
jgi:ATP-dependent DNA helicase PIF1